MLVAASQPDGTSAAQLDFDDEQQQPRDAAAALGHTGLPGGDLARPSLPGVLAADPGRGDVVRAEHSGRDRRRPRARGADGWLDELVQRPAPTFAGQSGGTAWEVGGNARGYYLNQSFDRNILVDTPERRSYTSM